MRRVAMFAGMALLAFAFMGAAAAAVRPATKVEIEALREAMQERLKDADSAKFKDVVVIDGTITCGLVNSKNSYGAYAGYTTFMGGVMPVPDKPPLGLIIGIDGIDENSVASVCAKKISAAGG